MGFEPRCRRCNSIGSDIHMFQGKLFCSMCENAPPLFPSQPFTESRVQPTSWQQRGIFAGFQSIPPINPPPAGFVQSPTDAFSLSGQSLPYPQKNFSALPQRRQESREDHFILDTMFPQDETITTEFKACRPQNFEQAWAIAMLAKYICAFLNTEGGTLYYGIRDDHMVRGLRLDSHQRDLLRLGIDHCANRFQPEVASDLISVSFSFVFSPQDDRPIPELFVVLIKVRKGLPGTVYFTPIPDSKAWVKREASVHELRAQSLVAFISRKIQPNLPNLPIEVAPPAQLPQERQTLNWQYWDQDAGEWKEYPSSVQERLEERKKLDSVIELTFRGFKTAFIMAWLVEMCEANRRIEAKRMDMRPSTSPRWVTSLDSELYTFDLETVQVLESAMRAGRSEVEIPMNDFTVMADLDRMRVTGDLPLLRLSQ